LRTIYSILLLFIGASTYSQLNITQKLFYSPLSWPEFYSGTPEGNVDTILSLDHYGVQYPQSIRKGWSAAIKPKLDSLLVEISQFKKDSTPIIDGSYKGLYHLSKAWDWRFDFTLAQSLYWIEKGAKLEFLEDSTILNKQKKTFTYEQGKYIVVIVYSERIGNSSSIYFDAYYYRKRGKNK
jgi:hypothetical protein